MLPAEKYKKVMKFTRLCASVCGADSPDPNYRPNIITYIVMLIIAVYFLLSTYTVHLKFSENWGALLESFCMVGSVFQGIAKLATGIIYERNYSALNIFILGLYEKYQAKNEKYIEALHKCVSHVTYMLKAVAVIYATIVTSFLTFPLVMYAVTNQRYLAMQFYLPGLHPETDLGYFATLAVQTVCLIFGGFGNFAGDMFVFVFNVHIILFVDILKLKIYELNEMTKLKVGAGEQTKRQLVDIVNWHQTYSNFAETCNTSFFWIIFAQVVSSGLSIVFTLFILLIGGWPGAAAYLVLQFSMLFFYCGMGTLVEISNDKFCEEIYSMDWYVLPVSQQKMVLLMLMKSQDPKLFMVGGVVPLSVNTALQVIKTVYSIMMMIMRFVE